jgi:8-oxo-dGTP pyrophosphatase MutT (NUDIX family)
MVLRHAAASFGAAFAFPGGVVESDDRDVHARCCGLKARTADAYLGIESGGLDYYSAAIRELFEEAGVLLAKAGDVAEDLDQARDGLNDGSDTWAAFVTRNRLALECGALHYVSHWITPPSQPQRYSTRFFVAELPAGQRAVHCGRELVGSRWTTARDMLAAGRNGKVQLHFPTVKTLESLARHRTFEGLMQWAAECVEWGVTTMAPVIIERRGKPEIVLPGDKDYPGIRP